MHRRFLFLSAAVLVLAGGVSLSPSTSHADTNIYRLSTNETGGDCSLVGSWNPDTKTCTLTTHVFLPVEIHSAGITLDGAGYTISGTSTGTGLGIHGLPDVVIKNLTVEGFFAGMQAYGVNNLLIDHVTFRHNEYIGLANFTGITFTDSTFIASPLNSRSRSYDLTFTHNTFDRGGLFLNGTYGITITDNIFGVMGSVYVGESDGCASTTISNNTLENGAISVRWSSGENAITNNAVRGEIVSMQTDNIVIADNRVNLATGGDWLNGIRVYDHTYGSLRVERNSVSGCSGQESYCLNYGFYRVTQGEIGGNSAEGGQIGFEFFNTAGLIISHNEVNDARVIGVRILDQNNYFTSHGPNVFSANTFRNGAIGIKADMPRGVPGSYIFSKNNFIGNTQDTAVYYPNTHVTFSQSLPEGGNYWDRYDTVGEGCIDANNDVRCDTPYVLPNVSGYPFTDEHPWINADGEPPVDPSCTDNCVSNIAFIPGFEGSRLYENNSWLGGEDQLWEPTKPNDVPELALNAEGVSIKPNVYTRDVIDTGRLLGTVGLFDVYKNFMASLDTLKDPENGIIADWRALPYDWRFDPRDVVAQGVRFENEVRRMEDDIAALAASSKTGKVTIVAHSMGGHVAKVLIDALKERGKADLIDKIIFVATPHLGTPKAIAGLLHGDGQEIPGKDSYFTGVLATPADARSLGLTLPSAHNLLPSSGYFGKVFDPVVDLTRARSLQTDVLGTYLIRDYDSLTTFLTAEGSLARAQPHASDVETPAVLSGDKLLRAKTLHDSLDIWAPPQGITTVNIVGWGLLTMRGIAYSEKQKNGVYLYHHDPLVTAEGDETVVYASAQGEGERYFVDLGRLYDEFDEKREHVDILESTPVRSLIKNLITHTATTSPPEFISTTKPELSTASSTLRLSVYSPADLHLYDSSGRHTGRLPSNDGFIHFEEGIPGTTYMELGESKHIIAPEGEYRSELQGTGEGTFDFIVRTSGGGGEETPRATYTDVPVSTETIATVAVSLDTPPAPLSLDTDGDGTEDESVLPEETNAPTFPELLALFRTEVDTLSTSPATKNNLLLRASSTGATYQKLLTLRETRKDRRTALATLFDTRLSSSFTSFLAYTHTLATLPPERKRKLTSNQEATLNALLKEIEASLAPDEESGLPPEIETVHALIENAKRETQTLSLHPSVLAQITNKLNAIETRHARALTRLGTFDARTKLAEANLKKVLTTKLTNLSVYTNRLATFPAKNKNRLTAEDVSALQTIISNLTNLIETI